MDTITYILEATPQANGRNITKTLNLTGAKNVEFDVAGLSGYDLTNTQKINKIIVDFDGDGEEDLTLNRPISGTEIQSISTVTFDRIIEPSFIDGEKRSIYFSIFRDDNEVDIIDLKLKIYHTPLSEYEDINLLKVDYFSDSLDDEKLLLSFINKNPETLGLSLMDIKVPTSRSYNPTNPGSYTNQYNFNVGFTTEYVLTNASDSNTGPSIHISLSDIYDTNTGEIKNNGRISLKFRTRVGSGGTAVPGMDDIHVLPSNPEVFYIPLTANSGFMHLSGMMTWNCGDLLKDVDLSTKTITIPLIDIIGTKTDLIDFYFTSYNVGTGTYDSNTAVPDGGYFFVDLYDVEGCDTVTTTTSTLTAFVNFGIDK